MKLLVLQYVLGACSLGAGILATRLVGGFLQKVIVLNAVSALTHILLMTIIYFAFIRTTEPN